MMKKRRISRRGGGGGREGLQGQLRGKGLERRSKRKRKQTQQSDRGERSAEGTNSPVKRAAVLWIRFIQIIFIRSLQLRDFLKFTLSMLIFLSKLFPVNG